MFGIFKKSKIVRKSDNLNDTTTKWFNDKKLNMVLHPRALVGINF